MSTFLVTDRLISLILTLKSIAMAMSLERWEKGKICSLRSNAYPMVKSWWKSVQQILRLRGEKLDH